MHRRGFEPLTSRFVAECSIQLSYQCMRQLSSNFNGFSASERGHKAREMKLIIIFFKLKKLLSVSSPLVTKAR
jgi:hypothetical protein